MKSQEYEHDGNHWKSLEIIGNHWKSLEIIHHYLPYDHNKLGQSYEFHLQTCDS